MNPPTPVCLSAETCGSCRVLATLLLSLRPRQLCLALSQPSCRLAHQPPPTPPHPPPAFSFLFLFFLFKVELRDLFKNQDATEFCIVTIPTQLAIAESKRLLAALKTQGVAVRNIVVNQV